MSSLLFIQIFALSLLAGKCVAGGGENGVEGDQTNPADAIAPENQEALIKTPNPVERMLLRVCADVLGIDEKKEKREQNEKETWWKRGMNKLEDIKKTSDTVLAAISALGGEDKSALNDAIRLHVLLKTVAGTTEQHNGLETFKSYTKLCEIMVEKFEDLAKEEKQTKKQLKAEAELAKKLKKKAKATDADNNESVKHGKKEKSQAKKSHHVENGEMNAEEEDTVAASGTKNAVEISMVLQSVGLTAEDWKNLVEAMPEITWNNGGNVKLSLARLQRPFVFGFQKQAEAEAAMLAAFHLVSQNNEKKSQKLYELCLQIEELARVVYAEKMKDRAGEFCPKILDHPNAGHHPHGNVPSAPAEQSDVGKEAEIMA